MSVLIAIRDYLLEDARLSSYLSKYDQGNGDKPAYFLRSRGPQDAFSPYVTLHLEGGDDSSSRKITVQNKQIVAGVHIDRQHSHLLGRTIADRIRALLDRQNIYDSDGTKIHLQMSPIGESLDDDGFPLYITNGIAHFFGGGIEQCH
jgi:hypothetical protein